jgi:hypothetical protein
VTHATAIIGRFLLALLLCLGLVRAETTLAADCRLEPTPAPCSCCHAPGAGCCVADENKSPDPAPALPAPAAPDSHLDLALVTRPLLVILPRPAAFSFSSARLSAARFSSGHSLQSLLCLRTV